MNCSGTFFAPGSVALGVFMRAFPCAGANITGLAIDFEGERGKKEVREEAVGFMIASGWTRKIDGKLILSEHNGG